MMFPLVILILGGLFLVGYGIWACVKHRRGHRERYPLGRNHHRSADTLFDSPAGVTPAMLWSSSSSDSTSSVSSQGGSCDSGGYDSGGSPSCDSGGDGGGGGGAGD